MKTDPYIVQYKDLLELIQNQGNIPEFVEFDEDSEEHKIYGTPFLTLKWLILTRVLLVYYALAIKCHSMTF